MLRFAANISLMFTEWPFADRFEAARDAGFEAVEFMFNDGLSADNVAMLLERSGLEQVLANMPLRSGSKGLAAIEGERLNFRSDFLTGLHFASTCKAPVIHMTAGIVAANRYEVACQVFQANTQWAIEKAHDVGVKVVIEAINQIAVPDYFVRSLAQAREWAGKCEGIGYILDIYHAAMEGLDPLNALDTYLSDASHVQLAGYPGRHEPDQGELPLSEISTAFQRTPYFGWVGCEYIPSHGTLNGLRWRDRF
jgi:hydroxypyruvate isomerase